MVRGNIDIKMAMFISVNTKMIRRMMQIVNTNLPQGHNIKEQFKMVSTMARAG
jgi:hypothetical protein